MENNQKNEISCQICGEIANNLCFECVMYLCDTCFKYIHEKNINKTHKRKKLITLFLFLLNVQRILKIELIFFAQMRKVKTIFLFIFYRIIMLNL